MPVKYRKSSSTSGFTLVEMAMVLLIVGLILGGLLPTISTQQDQQHVNETRKSIDEIKEALLGYAIANGRFPCPASATSDGVEDPVGGGNCAHFFDGFLPASTLGISAGTDGSGFAIDAWGNRIHYAVTSWTSLAPAVNNVFTTTNGIRTVGISNLSPNNVWRYLLLCSTAAGISGTPPTCDSGPPSTALASMPGVPIVIYSVGKNGASGGTGADEAENPNPNSANNDRLFISHPQASGFDDIVEWISPNILYNRMVAAGILP